MLLIFVIIGPRCLHATPTSVFFVKNTDSLWWTWGRQYSPFVLYRCVKPGIWI